MRVQAPAHAELLPFRSREAPQTTTSYVGMLVFVAAWTMMFACLFFAYGAVRLGTKDWPPAGQPTAPLAWLTLSTVLIAASSFALEYGLWALRRRLSARLAPALALAALLGAGFVLMQAFIGRTLLQLGLTPASGAYGSVFYGLAGIHGLHAVIGVLALLALTVRAWRGTYTTPRHLPVRLWSVYWHFVGAVWLLMFLVVFCV